MKASEARKLAKRQSKELLIKPALKYVLDLIQKAAYDGKYSIQNPFADVSGSWTTHEIQEAVYEELQKDSFGYKVVHHPDPDPGNICSRPYTTINW